MSAPDENIDDYFSTARVGGRAEALELPTDSYLNYLLDRDDPKVADARAMSYTEFADDRATAPFLQDLLTYWDSLYREPFVGITSDGNVRTGLYDLEADVPLDPRPAAAARRALASLDAGEQERFRYPIDAPQWRAWSNPEFVVHRVGLRLEDLDRGRSDSILEMVEASLSPEGYRLVREAMALNGYLGELVDLPNIMNERSYWASLFGDPTGHQPWGWQLFGHHVAVNFLSVGGRHVVAPVFLGAEPALTDGERPSLFGAREQTALNLAASLSGEQRDRAVLYDSVLDPRMPEGRVHPADERHVAGAFRDNRVIPYEGLAASVLTPVQRSLLRVMIEDFLVLLEPVQRKATMRDVDAHLDETWFSWYGPTDGSGPFYFRIQSPVALAELDHHAGVWLTNRLPARFHVHTTFRLPNGNDYGRAYLDQWCARTGVPRST